MKGAAFGEHSGGEILHHRHVVDRRGGRQTREEGGQLARQQEPPLLPAKVERPGAVMIAVGEQGLSLPIPPRERKSAAPRLRRVVSGRTLRPPCLLPREAVEGEDVVLRPAVPDRRVLNGGGHAGHRSVGTKGRLNHRRQRSTDAGRPR